MIKLASSLLPRTCAHTQTHVQHKQFTVCIYSFFFHLMYCIHIYSCQYPHLSLSLSHTDTNIDTLLHCTLSLTHTHTKQDIAALTCTLSQTHTHRKRVRHCTVLSLSLCLRKGHSGECGKSMSSHCGREPTTSRTSDAIRPRIPRHNSHQVVCHQLIHSVNFYP